MRASSSKKTTLKRVPIGVFSSLKITVQLESGFFVHVSYAYSPFAVKRVLFRLGKLRLQSIWCTADFFHFFR